MIVDAFRDVFTAPLSARKVGQIACLAIASLFAIGAVVFGVLFMAENTLRGVTMFVIALTFTLQVFILTLSFYTSNIRLRIKRSRERGVIR